MRSGCCCNQPYLCSKLLPFKDAIKDFHSAIESILCEYNLKLKEWEETNQIRSSLKRPKSASSIKNSSSYIHASARPLSASPSRSPSKLMSPLQSDLDYETLINEIRVSSGLPSPTKRPEQQYWRSSIKDRDSIFIESSKLRDSLTANLRSGLQDALEGFIATAIPLEMFGCPRAYSSLYEFFCSHISLQYNSLISTMSSLIRKEMTLYTESNKLVSPEKEIEKLRVKWKNNLTILSNGTSKVLQSDKEFLLLRLHQQEEIYADLHENNYQESTLHRSCFEWLQCLGDCAILVTNIQSNQCKYDVDFYKLMVQYQDAVQNHFSDLRNQHSKGLAEISRIKGVYISKIKTLEQLQKCAFQTFCSYADIHFRSKYALKSDMENNIRVLIEEMTSCHKLSTKSIDDAQSRIKTLSKAVDFRFDSYASEVSKMNSLCEGIVEEDVNTARTSLASIWMRHAQLCCKDRREAYLRSVTSTKMM